MSKRSSNDILHRYFSAGDYSSGVVTETVTPSMDIQVSSNFERFLYHMSGELTLTLTRTPTLTLTL